MGVYALTRTHIQTRQVKLKTQNTMPGEQIYAKAIENVSITAVGTTIPYINITFDVKENWNNSTGAYDSYYQYSYDLPIAETSMTFISVFFSNS